MKDLREHIGVGCVSGLILSYEWVMGRSDVIWTKWMMLIRLLMKGLREHVGVGHVSGLILAYVWVTGRIDATRVRLMIRPHIKKCWGEARSVRAV